MEKSYISFEAERVISHLTNICNDRDCKNLNKKYLEQIDSLLTQIKGKLK